MFKQVGRQIGSNSLLMFFAAREKRTIRSIYAPQCCCAARRGGGAAQTRGWCSHRDISSKMMSYFYPLGFILPVLPLALPNGTANKGKHQQNTTLGLSLHTGTARVAQATPPFKLTPTSQPVSRCQQLVVCAALRLSHLSCFYHFYPSGFILPALPLALPNGTATKGKRRHNKTLGLHRKVAGTATLCRAGNCA